MYLTCSIFFQYSFCFSSPTDDVLPIIFERVYQELDDKVEARVTAA